MLNLLCIFRITHEPKVLLSCGAAKHIFQGKRAIKAVRMVVLKESEDAIIGGIYPSLHKSE
jgi:hypothetical protein